MYCSWMSRLLVWAEIDQVEHGRLVDACVGGEQGRDGEFLAFDAQGLVKLEGSGGARRDSNSGAANFHGWRRGPACAVATSKSCSR